MSAARSSSTQPLVLPGAPAWFRFRAADGGARVGAVDPGRDAGRGAGGDAGSDTGSARFVDLGPLDVAMLLARGELRSADLAARIAKGHTIDAPRQFLPPVPRGGKILCIAKNYVAHAREFGAEVPAEPIFFSKLPDTLIAHGDPVVIPHWLSTRVDHEAELALVLGFHDPDGGGAKYTSEARARSLVAGYTLVNDVTARKLQGTDRDQKYPWLRSKSFDTFCPCGPFVVPADAIAPDDLQITMRVNGAVKQQARTKDMVFSIDQALAAMARCTTLRPGDLIATGTPEGVGPVVAGDVMEVEVEKLGVLRNPVLKEEPR